MYLFSYIVVTCSDVCSSHTICFFEAEYPVYLILNSNFDLFHVNMFYEPPTNHMIGILKEITFAIKKENNI